MWSCFIFSATKTSYISLRYTNSTTGFCEVMWLHFACQLPGHFVIYWCPDSNGRRRNRNKSLKILVILMIQDVTAVERQIWNLRGSLLERPWHKHIVESSCWGTTVARKTLRDSRQWYLSCRRFHTRITELYFVCFHIHLKNVALQPKTRCWWLHEVERLALSFK